MNTLKHLLSLDPAMNATLDFIGADETGGLIYRLSLVDPAHMDKPLTLGLIARKGELEHAQVWTDEMVDLLERV